MIIIPVDVCDMSPKECPPSPKGSVRTSLSCSVKHQPLVPVPVSFCQSFVVRGAVMLSRHIESSPLNAECCLLQGHHTSGDSEKWQLCLGLV